MDIKQQNFGRTQDGRKPQLFILSNDFMEVSLTNFGGIVSNLKNPDRNGNLTNIVLGFDSVEKYQSEQYLENCPYFGAIIGRVCNRISKGKFTLNGKQYSLPN